MAAILNTWSCKDGLWTLGLTIESAEIQGVHYKSSTRWKERCPKAVYGKKLRFWNIDWHQPLFTLFGNSAKIVYQISSNFNLITNIVFLIADFFPARYTAKRLLEVLNLKIVCRVSFPSTQTVFHVGRPEYVWRRLRKLPWRTKEKSCFSAYWRQKFSRITVLFYSLAFRRQNWGVAMLQNCFVN